MIPNAADDAALHSDPRMTSPFMGASTMAARCRAFDWNTTALGATSSWPLSLRTVVAVMLESRHPMFLWWGPELIQIYNDGYLPSFGSSGRDVAALGARGRAHWAEIWPVIGPQIDGVLQRGEATWHEDHLIPIERNGRLDDVWWTYGYSPVRDDAGEIAGVLVVVQETTSRMLAHAAVDAERFRIAELIRRAPAFISVVRGPALVFELVNDAYRELVGDREMVGRSMFDVIPEARGQGFEALLTRVLTTGEPYVGHEVSLDVMRTPGGPLERRYINFVYAPLDEADGTRTGVFTHGVDVTQQVLMRRTAEAAQERLIRLQALTEALSAAATPGDVAEAIVAHATQMLGAVGTIVARVEPGGDRLDVVRAHQLPDDLRAQWERIPLQADVPLAESVRTEQWIAIENREAWAARYPHLLPAIDATGHVASVVVPLVGGGRVIGAMGAAYDAPRSFDENDRSLFAAVAERCGQALERALLLDAERRARAEAEAANRAKGEFLAVMSHELRTPLNAIGGYAELMELGLHGPVSDQQQHDLARIQHSQRHLLGMINQVLNYTRVERGAVQYDLTSVRVSDALAAAESLVGPQVRAHKLRYVIGECDPALGVRADEEKLRQILINLLTNAIKFTDDGGEIVVSYSVVGANVAITVHDTGIGIEAAKLSTIFEPFVQVDPAFTRTRDGVGLGLAISRDLARGMGGDLRADSVPGIGSTFTLTMPLAPD